MNYGNGGVRKGLNEVDNVWSTLSWQSCDPCWDSKVNLIKTHHLYIFSFSSIICLFKLKYNFIYFLGSTKFYCNNCNRSYKYRQSLKLHQRVECGKAPTLVCSFCDKKFYHKGNLQSHLGLVHKKVKNF